MGVDERRVSEILESKILTLAATDRRDLSAHVIEAEAEAEAVGSG